jgi:hypothetical protein
LIDLPLARRCAGLTSSDMPGKKKSHKGAHLKAASGKRPERKYTEDADADASFWECLLRVRMRVRLRLRHRASKTGVWHGLAQTMHMYSVKYFRWS